jgi:Bacterial Ig-like domain (group 2)
MRSSRLTAAVLALLIVVGALAGAPAVAGAATASSGDAKKPAPIVSAFAERPVLPPGATTMIRVLVSFDGGFVFTPVEKAKFTSTDRSVVTVARDGTVTAVAVGLASVIVTAERQQVTVAFDVRNRALLAQPARVGGLFFGEMSILLGFGFAPNSVVTFTTNGVEGVFLSTSTVMTDATGSFSGSLDEAGFIQTGPYFSVQYTGGSSPGGCPPGAVWIITATDTLGQSESIQGTCP